MGQAFPYSNVAGLLRYSGFHLPCIFVVSRLGFYLKTSGPSRMAGRKVY
jgi:hypothetical protein